ncbi:divergent polysaccharide deacetylase family protein [Aestuariicoccus sp. MJ-SS9]|uniref:divergent polysaccharide deacetylase family protein n=1 Tax=Aestuariicoccus sp. MJ-SS9 TaxID=3079855 RepID=UPI00290DFD02|nr:divergent polysaccharide deacetylase family protein [Aestuariicoccus sp. MJ-SS9]MDU8911474.1 divergent polysaccharide deacetylase family protein [Aestuariicoccus sp. MJ-SS9]
MARGFLLGAIWGGVVSAAAAGALSLYLGPPVKTPTTGPYPAAAQRPSQPEPDATPVTTPDPVAVAPARRPAAETGVEAPPSPGLEAAPEAPATDVTADTAPARVPEAATDTAPPPQPAAIESGADVAVAADAPVQPGAQAAAPVAPEAESDLSISTDPAQPPMPPVPAEESALAPEAADPVLEPTSPAEDAAAASAEAAEEVPAPAEPEGPAEDAAAAPAEAAEEVPAPAGPEDQAEDAAAAPAEAAEEVPAQEETETAAPEADDAATRAEDGDADRPAIGTPAVSLLQRDDAAQTGRLPTVGGGDDAAPSAQDDTSPLTRYAAPFDVADDLPRMSIVLIDDGTGPLGASTLQTFPFPLSFAISPGHPDAAGAARAYRALGYDVLALADIPEGARASDVEVALAGSLAAVPEAVAVMEQPGGAMQSTRDVTEQLAAYLLGSGHGLVMLPNGLNTAQALAAREGVPSASVFRDFDGAGQDPRVMRRFLDQAAFKARQEGAVVMLGRLQADTISALLLWGLQDRADSVALVPVSVVLKEAGGL